MSKRTNALETTAVVVFTVLGAIVCAGCRKETPVASAGARAEPALSTAQVPSTQIPQAPGPTPEAATSGASPEAEHEKGAALAAEGRFDEARQVFEAAARVDPTDGSLSAAVAILNDLQAKRIDGEVVRRLFRSMQHANAGRWSEAHADADEAIKLAPAYPRAYGLRGTLFVTQGKYQEALGAFDQVVKLDPKFAEGYYNRGATRSELDQYDAAIRDYDRAIELQPDFADAYRNRGSAHLNRGLATENKQDLLDAMADYTKAHDLAPRAVEPLYLRGVLYALSEAWDAAVADFTAVIERDERHAEAYYNRGFAYQNLGDEDRAVADYTRSIEFDPADPKPLINRGLIYAKRKDVDRALADYDKAASVAPALLNSYYNKGLVLEQAGRPTEAAAAYRLVLQKAGSDDAPLAGQARQRLAEIEKAPKK